MSGQLAEYVAIALFEGTSDADDEPLYEECFYLVEAKSEEEARQKIRSSVEAPFSYENESGEEITWILRVIVDVSEILYDDPADVRELYARHFRDIHAYERWEPLLDGRVDRHRDDER